MFRTSTLLFQPTNPQRQRLKILFRQQRELYNAALEERRGAWKWEKRNVFRFDQYIQLTGWDYEPLLQFGTVPARGTLLRLDRAFQGFFRRIKQGEIPGFPRFRSANRWDSVEYPDQQHCWKIRNDDRLYLQGIGEIKFRTSKQGVRGVPKTLVIRREGRRYRAYVVCEIDKPEAFPKTGKSIGLDLGITSLLTTSEGEHIKNGRFTKRSEDRLAEAQQLVSGRKRGSHRRRKAGQLVGNVHRKIRNQRKDYAHKLSRQLINEYDFIAHEKLTIQRLIRRPKLTSNGDGTFVPNAALNKSIHDAGWGQFLQFLSYKAEEAGREVVSVNPRHTSQKCSCCGYIDEKNRVGVKFRCQKCEFSEHADTNAAVNILGLGQSLRLEREASSKTPVGV